MNNLGLILLVALLLLPSSKGFALELYSWTPNGHSSTFVIGVKKGESPEVAAFRYLKAMKEDPRLQDLTKDYDIDHLTPEGFFKLNEDDIFDRALLIANRPTDLSVNDSRVESFVRIFKNTNTKSYIVPFAADMGLTKSERSHFFKLLNSQFPSFVAMGGADVDVRLWNQELHSSSQVNTRRDQFEIGLVAEKLKTIRKQKIKDSKSSHQKHRLLGVCRGAQLIARVMGYELGVDVPGHGGAYVTDHDGRSEEPAHEVEILETKNSYLKSLMGGLSRAVVNTYHHQFVNWTPGGELQLAAISPDGVPEAFESEDGSILLMQFHPELMAVRSRGEIQSLGERIMNGVIEFLFPSRSLKPCELLLQ